VLTVVEELFVEVVVEVPVGVVPPLPVVGTTIASSEESYCAIAGLLPNNTDNAKLLRNTNLKGPDDINHPPVKMIGSYSVVLTKIFGK